MVYETNPRTHLTQVTGSPNKIDYQTTTKNYYDGVREIDQVHLNKVAQLKSRLRGTSYSIGRRLESPEVVLPSSK